MLYVFTSCALNFVPCAKLLAASVKKHMPDARFVLTLTDDKPEGFQLENEGFDEVFYLEDFADQLENPRAWAFGHTIMELATAVKPFTASKLLEREDCDAVMFFDPDCVLFGPMTEMRAALDKYSVVLTPHASELHENKDWLFFEMNPLKVGGFNLGFFGFKNNETGRAVSSWWRYRLRDLCLIDPERGLFTDQKWLDLLPNYIDDLKIMRDPVYNIARWNTFQRKITKKGRKFYANGEPVQFIHFSGFYKIGPYVQGLYDKKSEPLIENLEPLQELSLWYGDQLDKARCYSEYTASWRLGSYRNGEDISEADRRRYKNEPALQARFPDPFDTSSLDSYWLFRRKEVRAEIETQVKTQAPWAAMVQKNTAVNNTLLRKHVQALEGQLVNTQTNLLECRMQEEGTKAECALIKEAFFNLLASAKHYRIDEVFDGVDVSESFDPETYLATHPDVAESGMQPLEHLLCFGLAENRTYPGFTAEGFLSKNMEHIIECLRPREGRLLSRLKRKMRSSLNRKNN